MTGLLRAAGLACVLTLGACAVTPTPVSTVAPDAWPEHQRRLLALDQWALNGRVVLKSGDQAWNGRLLWQQQGAAYLLQFSAPFGQGAFRLEGQPEGVAIRFASGEEYTAADAESLLHDRLGWRIPLTGLRFWVMGLPDPSRPAALGFDPAGRLATLAQGAWRIRYPDYQPVGGLLLPGRIELENSEISVRLVVDRWEVPGA